MTEAVSHRLKKGTGGEGTFH